MSKTKRYLRTKTRTEVVSRKKHYKLKEKTRSDGYCDVCGLETDENGFCDTPALCRLEDDLLKE